jgi:16S rRNA processing protein RimM
MESKPARVCLGIIVGSKGLRGEVKVKSYTDDPQDVAAYGPVFTDDNRTLTLTATGSGKGVVIAKVDGVDDRTQAEALKGLKLHVDRSALPPPGADSLYQADLVGLQAERTDGESLGTVVAFHNFGAGDVMEVQSDGGESVLIPFTEEAIAEVDMTGHRILVTPMPGLFDDGETDDSTEAK